MDILRGEKERLLNFELYSGYAINAVLTMCVGDAVSLWAVGEAAPSVVVLWV